jgi:DNA-binding response OmpR family regulator
MLHAQNLTVLIVDDDDVRATHVAHLVRVLGSVPLIARKLDVGARLVRDCDVVIADDDAFGRSGASVCQTAGIHVYRCVTASGARFGALRGVADYVIAKPFTAMALGDVLSAAHSKRRKPGASAHAH